MQIFINKKNKLLKKSAYVEIDGFVFSVFSVVVGFPDASVEEEENIFPNMDESFPDASVAVFPDGSEENIFPNMDESFPDASVAVFPDASLEENIFPNMDESFPDASVAVFPDASLEENGDEKLNASLFDENNALIGVVPFKNDFIWFYNELLFLSMLLLLLIYNDKIIIVKYLFTP